MSYVQIIGWHDYFVPPALQIFSEGCYFLFNCGENSQRFRLSNKLGLAKIRYIFLTNLSAHSFSGLPSLILSLDGCNTPHITVFGPSPLKEVLNKMLETFHELKIHVTVEEVDSEEASELVRSNSLTISGFRHESKQNSEFTVLPIHNRNVGYLVRFDRVPGTFNPERAKELGVERGPDFGTLKKGFDITLPDGTLLKSEQVCDPPTPGKSVLILDHPHECTSVRNMLLDENLAYTFYLHSGSPTPSKDHISCNRTAEDTRYIALPPYYHRNALHHSIFPRLFPSLSPSKFQRMLTKSFHGLFGVPYEQLDSSARGKHSEFPPLTKFFVHPPKKITVDHSDSLRKDLDVSTQLLTVTQVDLDPPETIDTDLDFEGPRITFLGTGCSVPSVYRNVSSTLVQIDQDNSILLDAGEGTVLQIIYTCEDFHEFVRKLLSIKMVFISHSHADHHLGLYYLLALQNKFKTDDWKTLVLCSDVIMVPIFRDTWLETYNRNICKLEFEPVVIRSDCETSMRLGNHTLKLSLFRVDHIFDSFGIKLSHEELGTLVYSGDTRPCESLVAQALDADILIHEATFTDEYSENAIRNYHTTISEAVEIAIKSRVKNLFVTHFSQRFQSIPNDYDLGFNLVMASDLMSIPVKALSQLGPHLKRFNLIVRDLVL